MRTIGFCLILLGAGLKAPPILDARQIRCSDCGRPLDQFQPSRPLSDNREICSVCVEQAVLRYTQLSDLYEEARRMMRRFYRLPLPEDVELHMVDDPNQLPGLEMESDGVFKRVGLFTTQKGDANIYDEAHPERAPRVVGHIYAVSGFLPEITFGVLAHEIGHSIAVGRRVHLDDLSFHEGFAEWLAWKLLIHAGPEYQPALAHFQRKNDFYRSALGKFQAYEAKNGTEATFRLVIPDYHLPSFSPEAQEAAERARAAR